MKPLRLALFIILLVFHAILVILSFNFSQSIADRIVRDPSAFRFLVFFGLAVFLVTFAFAWFDRRTARKRIEKVEAEKNAIKAEVFDREQRAKEREQEIDREIKSFEKSLPAAGSRTDDPVLPEQSAGPHLAGPQSAESYPTESKVDKSFLADTKPPKSHLTESHLTESPSDDSEQVEYGPLTPKRPIPDESINDEDTTTDDNPSRS